MVLARQIVDIPLGAGMAEKIDPLILQPDQGDAVLENARFDDFGRVAKRYGYTYAETPGGNTLHSLIDHDGAVMELQRNGDLYTYHANRTTKWAKQTFLDGNGVTGDDRHPATPIEILREPVATDAYGIDSASVARVSTFLVHAWITATTTGCIGWRITDKDGHYVASGTYESAGGLRNWDRVWVFASGTNALIVAQAGTYWQFLVTPLASAWTGTWTAADATLAGAGGTATDCCIDSTNAKLHIVRVDGADLYLQRYAITSTTVTADQDETHAFACANPVCCWHPTDSRLWVQATIGGDIQVEVYASDYSIYRARATIETPAGTVGEHSICPSTTGMAWSHWEDGGGGSWPHRLGGRATNDGSVATFTYACYAPACWIAARGVYDSGIGRAIIPASYAPTGSTQAQGWLLSSYNDAVNGTSAVNRFGVVGKFAVDHTYRSTNRRPGRTVAGTARTGWPAEAYHYIFPALTLGATAATVGYDLYHIIGSVRPVRTVYRDGVTYWASGGMLWSYDGVDHAEAVFHQRPEGVTTTLSAAGGLGAGAYSWCVVWEWEDRHGNLVRSGPSASVSATATAGQKATITWGLIPCTGHDIGSTHRPWAVVYRTKVGSTTFYRAGAAVESLGTWVDTVTDANLGAVLYTEGGVLEASHIPPALDVMLHKERFWLIDAERRQEIYYSKLLEETVGPEFNGALIMRLPEGEATALGRLGDAAVIFAATAIYVVQGDGPNNLGEQDTFNRPQRIVSDVGCIDRNSVVDTPIGIIFRSKRGLELLTPDFALAPFEQFGGAVQDTLPAEAVLAAVMVPSRSEVRISFRAAATWPVLVYNYTHRKWSNWTSHTAIRDARLVAGVYVWAAGDGDTYVESSAYSDNIGGTTTHITLKIVTPWIKLAGLQGFKRVRRVSLIGAALDECGISVQVMRDYSSTVVQTETITFSAAEDPAQRMIHVAVQKLEAIKFDLRDAGNGENPASGFQFVGLALECAGKQGLFKISSGKVT